MTQQTQTTFDYDFDYLSVWHTANEKSKLLPIGKEEDDINELSDLLQRGYVLKMPASRTDEVAVYYKESLGFFCIVGDADGPMSTPPCAYQELAFPIGS